MPCESEDVVGDEKVANSKKICLKLQSHDRKVRKQAYIEMEIFLLEGEFNNQELRIIFCEIHMYILNGLRDKTEAVREQAITFLKYFFINKLPLNDFYLTYLFPVLVERIGSVELIEESEEIRLQLLQLLDAIITKYSNTAQLKPFLSDSVLILAETVKDKYPAIKELSCYTIIKLAQSLPSDFHMHAEVLVKPVISCFCHQRYKVRLESINAIGEIIMHCTYKGLDEAVGPLAEKLFDQIPAVRCAVARVAARWLLEYKDRYSFFHKILPLLLTGLHDEVMETRIESENLWIQVGLQYQQENEKDLKDQLDYLIEPPKYYPVNIKRPNLGCRVLVQRNIGKFVGAISRELTCWQEDVRVRCSQLLCVLALHAEEQLTQNIQGLLSAMYTAARDDDSRVVANIVQSSEIIGHFVKYDTWSKFVLPAIEDGCHYGHLTVLAGLIKGSPSEYITKYVEEVSKLLAEDFICCSRKDKYQLELAKCVKVLSEKHTNETKDNTGYNLFKIIITLISLKHPENDEKKFTAHLENIKCALMVNDTKELWSLYVGQLLDHINMNPKNWTPVTDQTCIFLTILSRSEEAFGENLEIIGNILLELLDIEADPETRLKTFYVLATVFERKDVIFKNSVHVTSFLEKLINDVFIPSLVWHAGATAEAIRTMAASCLQSVLIPIPGVDLFSSSVILKELVEKLLPLLISLLEDASFRSRQIGIECLLLLKENCSRKGIWCIEDFVKIYPEILKRLDDPTEKVRYCALRNISAFMEDAPEEFRRNHYKAHHEIIIDTLLTHFDDDEEFVQGMVSKALKVLVDICKEELIYKIERHKPLLRNQEGCEEIIQFCMSS